MGITAQLKAIVDGMPPGSSVSLPVDWLRALLAEAEREGEAPEEYLTLAQVAERVGRAESTVRTWCNRGQLEGAFRLNGRDWRVPSGALSKWLSRQQEGDGDKKGIGGHVDLSAWRRLRGGEVA
jgi:excisionase family DNA binding protein